MNIEQRHIEEAEEIFRVHGTATPWTFVARKPWSYDYAQAVIDELVKKGTIRKQADKDDVYETYFAAGDEYVIKRYMGTLATFATSPSSPGEVEWTARHVKIVHDWTPEQREPYARVQTCDGPPVYSTRVHICHLHKVSKKGDQQ